MPKKEKTTAKLGTTSEKARRRLVRATGINMPPKPIKSSKYNFCPKCGCNTYYEDSKTQKSCFHCLHVYHLTKLEGLELGKTMEFDDIEPCKKKALDNYSEKYRRVLAEGETSLRGIKKSPTISCPRCGCREYFPNGRKKTCAHCLNKYYNRNGHICLPRKNGS